MTEICRWPEVSSLMCGCRVALRREGEEDMLMYFPCDPLCPQFQGTVTLCKESGIAWEEREHDQDN